MRILFAYKEKIPEEYRGLIRNKLGESFDLEELEFGASVREWIKKIKRCDAALFVPSLTLDDKVLEAGRHLKLIQLMSSGYDKFNVAFCRQLGIPVATNGGANAHSVAEYAILLMLAVGRRLVRQHLRAQVGSGIDKRYGFNFKSLRDKTVGIIGFGCIGQLVAKKLQGFETKVIATDKRPVKSNFAEAVNLDDLLRRSDFITLHARAGDGDELPIIGERELGLMKKGVIIVNTARPRLVDYDALYRAITGGWVAGAGIDVWPDKHDTNNPLLCHENVIASPHVAGANPDAYKAAALFALSNFKRIAAGEQPLSLVKFSS